jgi:hypothetical protein
MVEEEVLSIWVQAAQVSPFDDPSQKARVPSSEPACEQACEPVLERPPPPKHRIYPGWAETLMEVPSILISAVSPSLSAA